MSEMGHVRHHALREQRRKWLLHVDQANMAQCARPETGIEQVQNGMFNAANILVHRKPFFRNCAVKWLVMRLAGKANEIPA